MLRRFRSYSRRAIGVRWDSRASLFGAEQARTLEILLGEAALQ
jgi:hypothetical protein